MKRIIVFRFHREPIVCKNRLRLLRLFNPDIEIYGLYGGDEKNFPRIEAEFSGEFSNIYCIRGKTAVWKWQNGDLALRMWYKDFGRDLNFDMLHFIEWDLLLLGPFDHIFRHVPENGVGISGLTLLSSIESRWPWTTKEPWKSEWLELLSFAQKTFNYTLLPHAGIACAGCLPKSFLEKYSCLDVPELCHDELRVPLFAQIGGFTLYDTNLYTWFAPDEEKFFNVEIFNIETKTVIEELLKPEGKRVFHPYRRVFSTVTDRHVWYNTYQAARDAAKKIKNMLGVE